MKYFNTNYCFEQRYTIVAFTEIYSSDDVDWNFTNTLFTLQLKHLNRKQRFTEVEIVSTLNINNTCIDVKTCDTFKNHFIGSNRQDYLLYS